MQGIPGGTKILRVEFNVGGALHDGTEVWSVTFDRPAPNVKVGADISMFPSVSHRPDQEGHTSTPVEGVLKYIQTEVEECLGSLSPFAAGDV